MQAVAWGDQLCVSDRNGDGMAEKIAVQQLHEMFPLDLGVEELGTANLKTRRKILQGPDMDGIKHNHRNSLK